MTATADWCSQSRCLITVCNLGVDLFSCSRALSLAAISHQTPTLLNAAAGLVTRAHDLLRLGRTPNSSSTRLLMKVKVTLRQTVSQSWCQAPSGAQDQIYVTGTHLQFCRCGTPSLTRGRVCHLPRRVNQKSTSKWKLLRDWLFTANQFRFVPGLLRHTTRDLFKLNLCGHSL
jgi:hypothetical protein